VHERIGGRQNSGITFCGGTYNAKGRKEGNHCCKGRTIIHKITIESTANHRGADNGISITKGDGDVAM
jgi:hypothetical protein